MKYIIKCLKGIHSKGDFTIRSGDTIEVDKEIYDYFNKHFAASGNFNFIEEGSKQEKPKPTRKPKSKPVKELEETKEIEISDENKES